MGWTSGDGGRVTVVRKYREPDLTPNGVKFEVIEHHAHGNQDWFLERVLARVPPTASQYERNWRAEVYRKNGKEPPAEIAA